MSYMTIGIIGCGNMGGALLAALQKQHAHSVVAFDPSREKVAAYSEDAYRDLSQLLDEADMLLIAVKPQIFDALAQEIGTRAKDKVVISIMAGISIARIENTLKTQKIIRCMPNMPVRIGKGVLGWYGQHITEDEKETVDTLLGYAGASIQLPNEPLVDSITLISGCGPAYVALFAEMLQKEAVRLGFDTHTAQSIVTGTFRGTISMWDDTTPFDVLCTQVTSKGGITEAVLATLAEQHFADIFAHGIDAGINRMDELKKK